MSNNLQPWVIVFKRRSLDAEKERMIVHGSSPMDAGIKFKEANPDCHIVGRSCDPATTEDLNKHPLMKTQQLPPELADEFYNALPQWVNKEDAEKCAQIAVRYADEQNAYIVHTFTESIEELRKQRDELLDALKSMKEQNMLSHAGDEIVDELINKIDGKE